MPCMELSTNANDQESCLLAVIFSCKDGVKHCWIDLTRTSHLHDGSSLGWAKHQCHGGRLTVDGWIECGNVLTWSSVLCCNKQGHTVLIMHVYFKQHLNSVSSQCTHGKLSIARKPKSTSECFNGKNF